MAGAAIGILCEKDRWRAMSVEAAADARRRFALDEVVPQYEALYRDA